MHGDLGPALLAKCIRDQVCQRRFVSLRFHEIIGRLPRDSYDTREDFLQDIREIYLADGIAPDKLPV